MENSGRDPIALGNSAIIALYIWLAFDFLLAFAGAFEIRTLSALDPSTEMTMSYSPPEAETAEMISGIVALVYLLVFIVAGFLILRWVYRVNKNAHLLSHHVTMSPGWNVGFFFIPIALLWKPFEGVRQSWQASARPEDPEAEPVPDLLRWWWGFWLASTVIGNISFRLSLRADTVSDQMVVSGLNLLSLVVDIPLAFTLAAVIRRLSAVQSASLQRVVFG
jgi:heme/copper-type cytochrome/quinol oxidase subunit 2